VVGHEQHGLVADDFCEPRAFGGIERRSRILVVIGDGARQPDLGLADLLDAGIFEPRQCAGVRHVGVKHRFRLRQRLVDRRVDAIAGALHLALTALDLAIVDADFHEAGSRHLGPMGAERDLVVAVGAAGHHEGQMVEDAFGKSLDESEPVRGGEIDPRLPLLGAILAERFRRNPELHELSP